MDDLINDFIAETRDMLQALSGALVAWEAAPQDRERLDEIFRFVHTVKGNCGFFDLPRLEKLSHAAEDALADVRAGRRQADSALVNAVLAILDRIGELVEALETGESVSSNDDRLIAALAATCATGAAASLEQSSAAAEAKRPVRSIRLAVDLLDRMMNGVSDAVLARNELARRLRESPGDVAIETAFERVSACIGEIRDAITRTRMQRIDSLFSMLPRMVRDLSAELDKKVTLEIDGGDVELDREMIEMIRDPLTHIVRNAIDHGIEPAAERVKSGKPASGTLRVCARQSGNQILIEVSDDGRGVDGEALARKAMAAGILSPERSDRLSYGDKLALIFSPGLSTAAQVTAISGRGVGMDVVRANIERIGGVVDVDSRPGQGLRLTIRVPLTLTIIPALTVSADNQVYAIPRSAIEEILRGSGTAVRIEALGGSWVATVRGRRLPLVALSSLLGSEADVDWTLQTLVLLKPAGGDVYALGVDGVHDHEELVVKPAAPAVMSAGLYAGTTLADDGRPILLLDPSGMAGCAGIASSEAEIDLRAPKPVAAEKVETEVPALLFRAFDGAKRAVRLSVLERIEDIDAAAISRTAGRLRVTADGRILPLAGCGDKIPEGKLRILRLTDGVREIAYGFAEVVDLVSLGEQVEPAVASGEICGVTLVAGEQVEVVDPYWLFAAYCADAPQEQRRPVCALPSGDPWMQNILRPMVEGLGYQVVSADAAELESVDLFISGSDDKLDERFAARTVRLRASPDDGGENDNSIYRYDKAGLVAALKSLAVGKGGGR